MSSEDPDYVYNLKCVLKAHKSDVRAVKSTIIPNSGILTGSRDSVIKLWEPSGKSFTEIDIFRGSDKFICSLCVLPPSAQYPKGLFLAGSYDSSIYGFIPGTYEPILRLLGHSETVCSLSFGKSGFLVSGSWDKTARVWSGQQCMLILRGHTEAVWATDVFPTQNLILTGSADRSIKLWRSGVCEKTYTGHEDCVRGLAILSDLQFLSCSNDATVRLWLTSGECLQVYQSHDNYIYSISLLSNEMEFVTCGEDGVKIWRHGNCIQSFVFAATSLWDVTCLPNEDIAVGTSDGKIYVLEKVPADHLEKALPENSGQVGERIQITESAPEVDSCMSEEETSKAEESALEFDNSAGYGLDGEKPIKETNTFPEFLIIGNSSKCGRDGEETIKVADFDNSRECFGESVVTYFESNSNYMYLCEYEATGVKVSKEEKNLQFIEEVYKKKNHPRSPSPTEVTDYSIDVEINNQPYKLNFNKGDNYNNVATEFVKKHKLSTGHINEIVEYLVRNVAFGFENKFYPAKKYLIYLNVNVDGLRAKLQQLSEQMPKEKCLTPPQVDELMKLAKLPNTVSFDLLSSLDKAFLWNDEFLFPILDLLRLGAQSKGLHPTISKKEFMNHLLHILMRTSVKVNRVLVEKILCNMFGFAETEEVLTDYQDKIFEVVKEQFSSGELSIQKAGSALLLNFAIASQNGFNLNIENYCLAIVDILNYLVEPEAIYRMLVAIGTVCTRNPLAISYFRSVDVKDFIVKFKFCVNDARISKIVDLLSSDL